MYLTYHQIHGTRRWRPQINVRNHETWMESQWSNWLATERVDLKMWHIEMEITGQRERNDISTTKAACSVTSRAIQLLYNVYSAYFERRLEESENKKPRFSSSLSGIASFEALKLKVITSSSLLLGEQFHCLLYLFPLESIAVFIITSPVENYNWKEKLSSEKLL